MGTKPSNNFQSDRPESGGADKDGIRESNGLLDRAKEQFAVDQAKREADKADVSDRAKEDAGEG